MADVQSKKNAEINSINRQRLETLLCDMIDIYSPSGKEVDVLIFLEKYLRRRNLPVHRIKVDNRRFTILVSDNPEESELLFVGHCDTVPAWDLDSFRSDEDEGMIYGLGAADMKGGCAAMVEAFCRYGEIHSTVGNAALALVVGEEETGDGAEALVAQHRAPWAIVGEPTELTTNPGHFGYIELELTTKGRRSHASLAKREHNAVVTMLTVLMKFEEFVDASLPGAIYNIRDVHSADAGFAVPDRCSASIDLHLPPDSPVGKIIISMENLLKSLAEKAKIEVSFDFLTVHHGFELPEDSRLPSLIRSVCSQNSLPFHTDCFKSHSDANILWAAGIKPVVLGPGSLARAHTQDECVELNQVVSAAHIYSSLLEVVNR